MRKAKLYHFQGREYHLPEHIYMVECEYWNNQSGDDYGPTWFSREVAVPNMQLPVPAHRIHKLEFTRRRTDKALRDWEDMVQYGYPANTVHGTLERIQGEYVSYVAGKWNLPTTA